jgi:dihydropyrimidine dehydrogenase (NAD+) subunit PreA
LVEQTGADIIECNFSCPQMTSSKMGSDVGQNPELVKKYTAAVKKGSKLPMWAKMTPNLGNMEIPAMAAQEGGADGIAAINTIKSIVTVDLDKYAPLPIVNGKSSISGYSGKAAKPIALRFIANMLKYPDFKLPVSGIGGIYTWEDAVHFLLVGARNLQVTTAIMQYGYRIVEDMISGLSHYMNDKGFTKLDDMIGLALKNTVPAEEIDRDFLIYPKFDHDMCVGCGQCYISCFDGAHQAIDWNSEKRRPELNEDKCVGCHLCMNVCPVPGCITPGEVKFKEEAGVGKGAKVIPGGNPRKIDIGKMQDSQFIF